MISNLKSILFITPYINEIHPGNFRVTSFIDEMKKTKKMHVVNTSESKIEDRVSYHFVEDKASTLFDKKGKLRNNPIFKTFFLPLFYLGWILSCYHVSSKLIEKEKIDYIFVSYRPPQIIIVGFLLKLKYNKCKLITEYRDSWTDNPYTKFPSRSIKKIAEIIEYNILDKSDLIIVVSVVEKNRFLEKYDHIEEKIVIIRNGFFDYEIASEKNSLFTITHSGSFFGSRQPDSFLKAYKKFIKYGKINDSQLVFVGRLDEKNIDKISKLGLLNYVELVGNLDYKESLSKICNSSALLLIEYTDSMTSKIYDYISSGNPIIALTNNIELIKFIKKYSPHSEIITENDIEKIVTSINTLYDEWKNGVKPKFNKKDEFFRKYSRMSLAKKLVHEIEQI